RQQRVLAGVRPRAVPRPVRVHQLVYPTRGEVAAARRDCETMAAESRRANAPLDRDLFDEAFRFDFFQAVRLLEQMHGDRTPVGCEGPSSREAVRFRARPSLIFPPSEIELIEQPDQPGSPARMTVAFLGLTGPSGVLPHVYTELLIERRKAGDHTLAAF